MGVGTVPRVRLIGLTGGIATGKSVVARILQTEFDAVVIDADHVVHQLMEQDETLRRAIVKTFGPEVLNARGQIDRRRLGAIVFRDSAARRRLEAMVHPRVIQETGRRIRTSLERGTWLVVGMAPLMLEVGTHVRFPVVVVTDCSEATQLVRLKARDGISEEEALRRIRAQWSQARKRAMADVVIDTDGSMTETRGQVLALVHWLWPNHPAIASFSVEEVT